MNTERIQISGEADAELSGYVKHAFDSMNAGTGKLPPELLSLHGMSGRKYRIFVNNLVGCIPNARYLEVGSWAGSTLCSAIYGNTVKATAIDNWSEFGGPSNKFFSNVGQFISSTNSVSVITSDFRKVSYESIGRHNVYLFDGPHAREDQYDGVYLALSALDEVFVLIVDDWNWDYVRSGTFGAIKDTNCGILYSIEILSTEGDVHPGTIGLPVEENSDWHNGYFIGVLRKNALPT